MAKSDTDVLINRSVRLADFTSRRADEIATEAGIKILEVFGAAIACFDPKNNPEHRQAIEDFQRDLRVSKILKESEGLDDETRQKLIEDLKK